MRKQCPLGRYELTVITTACLRPMQVQARPNSSMSTADGYEVPPLDEELLAVQSIDGDRESQAATFQWKVTHPRILGSIKLT